MGQVFSSSRRARETIKKIPTKFIRRSPPLVHDYHPPVIKDCPTPMPESRTVESEFIERIKKLQLPLDYRNDIGISGLNLPSSKLTSRSSPPAVDSLAGASCGDPNTFSSHESILMASKTQRRNTCTLDEVRVILSSPHYELLPNPIRRNWDLDKFLLFKQHYKIVRTTK